MSLMNNRKSLIAATVASAMVFVIVGSLILKTPPKEIQSNLPKYQYVISKTDIKKGDVIKEEDIEMKDFGINIEGTYKATGELIGRNAKTDIASGKPIIKNFIEEIKIKQEKIGIEPQEGYRAIPVLIRKSAMPPYLSTETRFDLFTRENSMKIENLKILNVLDPTRDESNKMLVLEIKNSDVSAFIEYQVKTKGFIFLQKNPNDVGEYKFIDIEKAEQAKIRKEAENRAKNETGLPSVPVIGKISPDDIQNINELIPANNVNTHKKEVEVIVGTQKTKVEFEN